MPDQVLGRRLYGDVGAVQQGLEVAGRGPGVVDHDRDVSRRRGSSDGGDVLHLEGVRAGRFAIDRLGRRPDELGDAGADVRRIELGVDALRLQHLLAQLAHRTIDRVDDQQVTPGLEQRGQRTGNRRQPGRKQHRPRPLVELRTGLTEQLRDRGPVAAVIRDRVLVRRRGIEGRHAVVQDRRGPRDGRIHQPFEAPGVASGVNKQRGELHR
jgi:hypothetical protein